MKMIEDCIFEIEKSGKMNVPARIFANPALMEKMRTDRTIGQLQNVAALPGIVKYAAVMPDGHEGYGFPIGGVAAFDAQNGGVVSPGGVGYDINCIQPGWFTIPTDPLALKLLANTKMTGPATTT